MSRESRRRNSIAYRQEQASGIQSRLTTIYRSHKIQRSQQAIHLANTIRFCQNSAHTANLTCPPQTFPVERSDTGCIEGRQINWRRTTFVAYQKNAIRSCFIEGYFRGQYVGKLDYCPVLPLPSRSDRARVSVEIPAKSQTVPERKLWLRVRQRPWVFLSANYNRICQNSVLDPVLSRRNGIKHWHTENESTGMYGRVRY